MKRLNAIFALGLSLMMVASCTLIGYADDTSRAANYIDRIWGASRYDTAINASDELVKAMGKDKLDCVVIACGDNYPDALAGGYLASRKSAPILLVTKTKENDIATYIKNKLVSGGKVYVLGGTGAVSESFVTILKNKGISNVTRLSGATRYDTNISILKEAGIDNMELLVCSGNGFADSLSAAATGRPVLLVGDKLTASQEQYLKGKKVTAANAIGGSGAVNDAVYSRVKTVLGVNGTRVFGMDRFKTSRAVADRYFKNATAVLLADGMNFPDGLSGGPLGFYAGAPVLLVSGEKFEDAEDFCQSRGLKKATALGGEAIIDEQVRLAMIAVG